MKRRYYMTLHTGEKVYYECTAEPKMMRCDGGARDMPHVYIRRENQPLDTGGWYRQDALHQDEE